LERVEKSLKQTGGSWREAAGNLRIWAERVLSTLSSYCPEPFVVFNDVPQSIDNYANITDRSVATAERDQIVTALRSPKFQRVLHAPAHDESLNEVEVRDALKALEPCRKGVKKEIRRFSELRRHEVQGRGVTPEPQENHPSIRILSFEKTIAWGGLDIVREAAAAHNGQGIEWDENDKRTLEGHPVVILATDVISPIGLTGQYLVLDSEERMPANKDLVAVETENGKRYVRRFWQEEDGSVVLEATNPTEPWLPVRLREGEHRFRRIVGVLFADLDVAIGTEGREWVSGELAEAWLNDVAGVRIRGSSMEPVVRNGQTVLVKKTGEIKKADLGCVDIEETGTVIKRCYPGNEEWVLCSVNPSEVEDPMRVDPGTIRYAYPVCGVMFEL
jgi:SOS-response transcriptional repressor LexA